MDTYRSAGPAQVDRRVLGPLACADGRAVDPDGAGQDDAAAVEAAGGIEDPADALDVQPDGVHRIGGHLVDVGHARQVVDDIAAE